MSICCSYWFLLYHHTGTCLEIANFCGKNVYLAECKVFLNYDDLLWAINFVKWQHFFLLCCKEFLVVIFHNVKHFPTRYHFILQADEANMTATWYQALQFYSQCLGGWRRRRKGLGNIMVDPSLNWREEKILIHAPSLMLSICL